jgi:membrane protein implicated in regulation of membrane protease activity
MNPKVLPVTAVAVSLAMISSGCENLTPGGNAAVFGTVTGLAVGIPLAAAGVDSRIAVPAALGAAALAAGVSYVIARHQATERQRKICEQRARLYMAQRAAAQQRARKQATASASGTKKAKAPKDTRYIAVKTQSESFNKGQSAVMIYDTQSNQIVGNNVYDLKTTPKVGQTSKFDTYTAEYVGTGS